MSGSGKKAVIFLVGVTSTAIIGAIVSQYFSTRSEDGKYREIVVNSIVGLDQPIYTYEVDWQADRVVYPIMEHNIEIVNPLSSPILFNNASIRCDNPHDASLWVAADATVIGAYGSYDDLEARSNSVYRSGVATLIPPNGQIYMTLEYELDFFQDDKQVYVTTGWLDGMISDGPDKDVQKAEILAELIGIDNTRTRTNLPNIICDMKINTNKISIDIPIDKPQLLVGLEIDLDFLSESIAKSDAKRAQGDE